MGTTCYNRSTRKVSFGCLGELEEGFNFLAETLWVELIGDGYQLLQYRVINLSSRDVGCVTGSNMQGATEDAIKKNAASYTMTFH
jgi:hypothetical protein